ncbi:MAG TPA: hypothetical protein DDZ83_12315 [Nitrospinae bacterium]|nr:hypothetical protein [Nitrospinota bacterium]
MDRAFLEDITREAGGLALELLGRVRSEKKGASLVSEADRAVERGIVSRIRSEYPDDFILAEESGTSGSDGPSGLGETTRWWAVDPIDGTGPYLANLPFWAVSVACMRGSRAEGGAVFLPAMSDMFSAVSGGPAHRNGEPLPPLRQAPPGDHTYLFVPCAEIDGFRVRYPGRRLSLAAVSLHLSYAAAGSSFGVVIEPTRAYDIAASALIFERAGGAVRYLSGKEIDYLELADGRRTPEPVVAAPRSQTGWLREQMDWTAG